MPDVALVQSASANGTATPAATSLTGVGAGNALIAFIAAIGTSPVIAAPGGYSSMRNSSGATVSAMMARKLNSAGGAESVSAVLTGTVTGWLAAVFEFSAMGANAGVQGNAVQTSAIAQLTNIFPTSGQTLPAELFVYGVVRATATMIAQNSWNVPNVAWSSSIQPQAGIQGLSMDFFWASNLGQGIGQYPQASGLLSGAVASVAIGAWISSLARQPSNNDNVNGNAGLYVPVQYAGMIGG